MQRIGLEIIPRKDCRMTDTLYRKINKKLARILTDEKLSAADRFWKAEKLLNREKNSAGVIVDMRRSTFKVNLLRLLKERSQSTGRFDGIQRGIAGRNPKNFGNVKKPT